MIAAAWLVLGMALAFDVPAPTAMVVDTAGFLPADVRMSMEAKLEAYQKATSIEIAVLIVPSLQGETVDEAANAVWAKWKIGDAGEDNGVLILLVPPPEKMVKIAPGSGMEPYLTDAACSRIIDDTLRPLNRAGKRVEALQATVDAVITKLGATPWAQRTPPTVAASDAGGGLLLLALLALGGCAGAFGLVFAGTSARSQARRSREDHDVLPAYGIGDSDAYRTLMSGEPHNSYGRLGGYGSSGSSGYTPPAPSPAPSPSSSSWNDYGGSSGGSSGDSGGGFGGFGGGDYGGGGAGGGSD